MQASKVVLVVKNSCLFRRHRFNPRVGKIPWRRTWQPTPVFLLGESHGQRILVGYSPWGFTESDTTEQLSMHVHTHHMMQQFYAQIYTPENRRQTFT